MAEAIIMMHQDSVTSTVLTVLVTAPTPKKPWTALYRSPSGVVAAVLAAGLAIELAEFCRLPSSPLSPEFAALLLTALLTAAACAPEPPGLVFWVGSVNGVTCAAVAAEAAYVVSAVAS